MKKLNIDGLPFICVKLSEADFTDVGAIYIIICVGENRKWAVIDVGQSLMVGTRINNHVREDCWKRNCPSKNIWVCVYKAPSTMYSIKQRLELEKSLRSVYNPNCGKR